MSLEKVLRGLASASIISSVVAIVYSIAVSQILLALALAFLLLSDLPLRYPPVKAPLLTFVAWTILSMLASPDPAAGLPQVRKFYILLIPLVLFSTLREVRLYRWVLGGWAILGALASLVAVSEFYTKWQLAQHQGVPFYSSYIADRITGFMGHWMTFGGQSMILFLMLVSLTLFDSQLKSWIRAALLVSAGLIAVGIILGLTRSVWLGTAAGGIYLVWQWRRKLLWLLPVAALLVLLFGPQAVKQRVYSLFRPHQQLDSNSHRIACWVTGLEMIRHHPLLGVGPERVGQVFEQYVPSWFPRPLPEGWYGHLHNIYIHYAAERGLPALAALLWLFLRMWRDWTRALQSRNSASSRPWLIGALSVLIAVAVSGFFEHNLGDTEVLTMFLTVISAAYLGGNTESLGRQEKTAG